MTDKKQSEATGLVVFGHDNCWQAYVLAQTLRDHGIEFEWRDVLTGDPQWREELKAMARGYLSVPTVVFPDGTYMVEPWPRKVLDKLGVNTDRSFF